LDISRDETSFDEDLNAHGETATDKDGVDTGVEPVTQAVSRVFPCQQCGADVVFDIGAQKLKCPFCSYEQDLSAPTGELEERDYHDMLETLSQRVQPNNLMGTLSELTCSSCGGTVVFEGANTSTRCPFCDTPTQRDDVHDCPQRINADGVMPFQVDRKVVRERLSSWVKSLWFAPNDFKKRGVEGDFDGIYLPFWTFDSLTSNAYVGQRGETYTVTVGSGDKKRTETRVRWYPASGQFQRFFDDVLILAGMGFPATLVNQLAPWPLAKLRSFTEEVLAGFLASTYTVELDQGFSMARNVMAGEIESEVRQRIGGDRQQIHDIKTAHHAIKFKHILLPVWSMTYRYKGKVYTLVVNGATGKVAGNRPYSAWKIAFAVILGAIAAGIAVALFNR
jgi:rubrerythrin